LTTRSAARPSPKGAPGGVAGAGRQAERDALWQALVARDVADEIVVHPDATIALQDAFGEGPGVLLISGTGSMALGRSPTGVVARCGGWGPVFGDEGGGAWISRRALGIVAAAADGREVKHTGDGIMASFVSAAAAIRCATQIQRALAKHQQEHGERSVKVRIGAAAGEPVEREHDLFGATVQLAARLCSHAQPEQILVSNVVAELCLGKGLPFKDLGDVSVRGFNRPIRVHAVEWSGTK